MFLPGEEIKSVSSYPSSMFDWDYSGKDETNTLHFWVSMKLGTIVN